jgi:hypothetical protein
MAMTAFAGKSSIFIDLCLWVALFWWAWRCVELAS